MSGYSVESGKTGWYSKVSGAVSRSSRRLVDRLSGILGAGKVDSKTLEDIEDILLESDFGINLTEEVIGEIRARKLGKDASVDELLDYVEAAVIDRLKPVVSELPSADTITRFVQSGDNETSHVPYVVMVSGVNGTGKTTTIGKMAVRYGRAGLRVLLVAADTFRAAAVEQLVLWAERGKADYVRAGDGADPSGLVWDAISRGIKERYDLVLIDTAGRLHNRTELMDQLRRMFRAANKALPEAPHQHYLVLDASTGQAALQQVEQFSSVAMPSGLIITKLDNAPKAGIVVAIASKFAIPLVAIGTGEAQDDLRHPDTEMFSRAIVGRSVSAD